LREKVAALSAENQLKAQKIEAQAFVIGSLKRRLGAQKLANAMPPLEISQRASAAVSALASRSRSNANEIPFVVLVDAVPEKPKSTVPSCGEASTTFDITWSSPSFISRDFKYSIDISACPSIRWSNFDEGGPSWSRRVQGELPMEIPLSAFSNHNNREQSHNDIYSSSSENSRGYRSPDFIQLVQEGAAPQSILKDRRRPRYMWRAPVRVPALRRRRFLEAFLRQQFAA
jgi:hypothetical protein